MKISEQGLSLIKEFEGCRLEAYQDSVGIWTIGFGWTHEVNQKIICSGMKITMEMANNLLIDGLEKYEQGVESRVKITINQNQFDALVDFSYNLGVGALANSTLLKKLNAGDYQAAADEFVKWNKAGGKVLSGLTRRRQAERMLFLS